MADRPCFTCSINITVNVANRHIQLKPDWLTREFLREVITKGKLDDILKETMK